MRIREWAQSLTEMPTLHAWKAVYVYENNCECSIRELGREMTVFARVGEGACEYNGRVKPG